MHYSSALPCTTTVHYHALEQCTSMHYRSALPCTTAVHYHALQQCTTMHTAVHYHALQQWSTMHSSCEVPCTPAVSYHALQQCTTMHYSSALPCTTVNYHALQLWSTMHSSCELPCTTAVHYHAHSSRMQRQKTPEMRVVLNSDECLPYLFSLFYNPFEIECVCQSAHLKVSARYRILDTWVRYEHRRAINGCSVQAYCHPHKPLYLLQYSRHQKRTCVWDGNYTALAERVARAMRYCNTQYTAVYRVNILMI